MLPAAPGKRGARRPISPTGSIGKTISVAGLVPLVVDLLGLLEDLGVGLVLEPIEDA
jgi:hypothetical protein